MATVTVSYDSSSGASFNFHHNPRHDTVSHLVEIGGNLGGLNSKVYFGRVADSPSEAVRLRAAELRRGLEGIGILD